MSARTVRHIRSEGACHLARLTSQLGQLDQQAEKLAQNASITGRQRSARKGVITRERNTIQSRIDAWRAQLARVEGMAPDAAYYPHETHFAGERIIAYALPGQPETLLKLAPAGGARPQRVIIYKMHEDGSGDRHGSVIFPAQAIVDALREMGLAE